MNEEKNQDFENSENSGNESVLGNTESFEENSFENSEGFREENVAENAESFENDISKNAENDNTSISEETNFEAAQQPMGKTAKKSFKPWIIVLTILVLIGSGVAFFWNNISNLVSKSTKTPQEYYAYVENKNVKESVSYLYTFLESDEKEENKFGTK